MIALETSRDTVAFATRFPITEDIMARLSRYYPPIASIFCLCYSFYFIFLCTSPDEFMRLNAASFSFIAATAFAIAWQTDNDIRRLIAASTRLALSVQIAIEESKAHEDRNKV